MNLLLFERGELNGSRLILSAADRRAGHIADVLGLGAGGSLRVGMINGGLGTGDILSFNDRQLIMEIDLSESPPAYPHIELILALPRPIMLQRILKQATVMGVRRFHLIRSRRVQKSFFQSAALQPQNLRELLIQGMEQAVDTHLPEVYIHQRFRPFVEDVLPAVSGLSRLLAHPGSPSLAELPPGETAGPGLMLAIGPEGGWNEFEIDLFIDHGFTAFSPGGRIMHVDTAVVALLAQWGLLQDLRKR